MAAVSKEVKRALDFPLSNETAKLKTARSAGAGAYLPANFGLKRVRRIYTVEYGYICGRLEGGRRKINCFLRISSSQTMPLR